MDQFVARPPHARALISPITPVESSQNALRRTIQRCTAILYMVIALVLLFIAIVVPALALTDKPSPVFACAIFCSTNSSECVAISTLTVNLVRIIRVSALVYVFWCARHTYTTLNTVAQPDRTNNGGIGVAILSAFFTFPVMYHAGIICLPDLVLIFTLYICIAVCSVLIQPYHASLKSVSIVVTLTVIKLCVVVAKITIIHPITFSACMFIAVDANAHIVTLAIRMCPAATADNASCINRIDVIQFITHIQYYFLFSIATYAAIVA